MASLLFLQTAPAAAAGAASASLDLASRPSDADIIAHENAIRAEEAAKIDLVGNKVRARARRRRRRGEVMVKKEQAAA